MNTTEIKPKTKAANWLRVRHLRGYASILRVNGDGEELQIVAVMPEEIDALIAALSKAKMEAA